MGQSFSVTPALKHWRFNSGTNGSSEVQGPDNVNTSIKEVMFSDSATVHRFDFYGCNRLSPKKWTSHLSDFPRVILLFLFLINIHYQCATLHLDIKMRSLFRQILTRLVLVARQTAISIVFNIWRTFELILMKHNNATNIFLIITTEEFFFTILRVKILHRHKISKSVSSRA